MARKPRCLYLALVIRSICIGILVAVVPLCICKMDLTGLFVGVLISMYAIAYAISSPMWGKMSDVFGTKAVLVLGMSGFSFVVIICSVAHDTASFLLVRLLHGFSTRLTGLCQLLLLLTCFLRIS
jgi:MFS family permease